jgi:hypothetical protein
MKSKYAILIIFLILIILVGVLYINYVNHEIENKYNEHIDFGYMSHYVKFHITPEQEGIIVVAWATDEFPPTTGYTDNNSEIVFPMISSAKYNILIDNNKCSYYIYPSESYYKITC